MNKMRRLLGLSTIALALFGANAAFAADKPEIKIGYVEGWADSVATTNVAANIIQTKLGYPVKLVPVAAGIMWGGVAKGDLDATLSAWLPVTHEAYYKQYKDKVSIVGTNYDGAKIGLIVPAYVTAKTVGDLEAQKDAFEGRIVGIDAGAGVMKTTEQAIKSYNLSLKLVPSSGPGMMAELSRSIAAHKSVAVTGWIPHFMFAKFKLKFLEDPKKVYGDDEHVDSVINPGLEKKAPEVVAFLKKFQWKGPEIGGVMLAVENGDKPGPAAEKWVKEHQARVGEWLK